jgi:hypothetical protein
MTMTWSRLMSAASATYGGYALSTPRHLGRFLTDDRKSQGDYDLLARTYGARDLAISAVGLLGRSERAVTAAMLIRVACDVSDGLLLAPRAKDEDTRAQVLAITFGWAGLNLLALARDRRLAKKKAKRALTAG